MKSNHDNAESRALGQRVPAWVWIATVALLFLTACVLAWKVRMGARDPASEVLRVVSSLAQEERQASTLNDDSSLRIVVVFRYNDCPPCLRALETVQTVVDSNSAFLDKGAIDSVAVGSGYTAAEAVQMARAQSWTLVTLGDPTGKLNEVLRGSSTPLVLVIGGGRHAKTLLQLGPAMLPVEREAMAVELQRSIHQALTR